MQIDSTHRLWAYVLQPIQGQLKKHSWNLLACKTYQNSDIDHRLIFLRRWNKQHDLRWVSTANNVPPAIAWLRYCEPAALPYQA